MKRAQQPNLLMPIRLKRKQTPTQWLRLGTQILFLVLTAYAIIRHRMGEAAGLSGPANQSPSVDALSPMGGLETLWTWVSTGQTLSHLHLSDLVLLAAAVVLVLALGPVFCGWICPFGALQEWLYRLRTRLLPWKVTVPERMDRILRYGRYAVLAVVLVATYSAGAFLFGDYCPWKAIWHVGSTELTIGGAIVLGLVVLGGLLAERAWCRYACPLGAFLGIFNKLTPVRLRRTEPVCSACGLCSRKCPLDLDIATVDVVTDTTCNRCLECVDSCPTPEALAIKVAGRPVKPLVYGALAGAIFGGVILLSQATGTWQATAAAVAPQADAATGMADPQEIKGWRTLQEVTDLWGIPQEVLYRELGLDPAVTPPSTALKDLEGMTKPDGTVIDRLYVVDLVTRWRRPD
jgi:ferredoxin